MAATYEYMLQTRNGQPVAQLDGIIASSWSVPGNAIPDASATIDPACNTNLARLIQSGATELVIYRDNVALETVFQLTNVTASGDANGSTLTLSWQGIASYLQHMTAYAGTVYTATAQSRIAWGLVNTFQARTGGSYGLVDGGAPSTDPVRSITYEEDTDVVEALQAIAELDTGFDFRVDAARRLRFDYPQRGTNKASSVRFEYGKNVVAYDYEIDTSPGRIVSDARVTGGPATATYTASNAATRSTYGRREATLQAGDVESSPSTLQNRANALVALAAKPEILPRLTLAPDIPSPAPFGSWWIGDTVTVNIKDGSVIDLRGSFRVAAVSCDISDTFDETMVVELMPA